MTESNETMQNEATTTTEPSTNTLITAALDTGGDTVQGADTVQAADTVQGTDTVEGSDTVTGSDTVEAGEEYTPFTAENFQVPEGYEFSDDRQSATIDIINKYQIPPEAVNELLALNGNWSAEDAASAAKAQTDSWAQTQEQWVTEMKADPIYGGEKLDGNLAKISNLLNTYSRDADGNHDAKFEAALRTAFDLTGAGNHPAMVRFLTSIADATLVTEGEVQPGGGGAKEGGSVGLYPNLKG